MDLAVDFLRAQGKGAPHGTAHRRYGYLVRVRSQRRQDGLTYLRLLDAMVLPRSWWWGGRLLVLCVSHGGQAGTLPTNTVWV